MHPHRGVLYVQKEVLCAKEKRRLTWERGERGERKGRNTQDFPVRSSTAPRLSGQPNLSHFERVGGNLQGTEQQRYQDVWQQAVSKVRDSEVGG